MVSSQPRPILRCLRSGPGPLHLRDVVPCASVYKGLGRKVNSLKLQLFGYAKGFPGESAWLKPLEGRELMNWHWPSKHKIPSFHVDQYFAMQASRCKPRGTHMSFVGLGRLLNLLVRRQHQVRSLLSAIGEKEFSKHPTLQDMYSIYRTLFADDPLRFSVRASYWRKNEFQWSRSLSPVMMLALLEEGATKSSKMETFLTTLNGARETKTVKELKEFLQRRLRDPDACEVAEKLMYLSTSSYLKLPGPCCSYQSQTTGLEGTKPPIVGIVDGDEASLVNDQLLTERQRARRSLLALSDSGSVKASTEDVGQSSTSSKLKSCRGDPRSVDLPSDGQRQTTNAKTHQHNDDGDPGLFRSLLRAPSVDYFPVCLDGNRRAETEQIMEESRAHRERIVGALKNDEALRTLYATKVRFQDPLFRRKRLSFLDRLARSRIKSQTAREMGSKLYAVHPDKQETFPVNKGLANREWPSPYH